MSKKSKNKFSFKGFVSNSILLLEGILSIFLGIYLSEIIKLKYLNLLFPNNIYSGNSNKLLIVIVSMISFVVILLCISIPTERFLNKIFKNYDKIPKKKYKMSKSDKVFYKKIMFIILISFTMFFRDFCIISNDKIYYSSFNTFFITKTYSLSEIHEVEFESYRQKGATQFHFNIIFDNNKVTLNSDFKDFFNKQNLHEVFSCIKNNSKDLVVINNLKVDDIYVINQISSIICDKEDIKRGSQH